MSNIKSPGTKAMNDCRLCTNCVKGRCVKDECVWLGDRIDSGTAGYRETIRSVFECLNPDLRVRINGISHEFKGSIWKDENHRNRMSEYYHKYKNVYFPEKNRYLAVVYLLSADGTLFVRTKGKMRSRNIDLREVKREGLTPIQVRLLDLATTLSLNLELEEKILANPKDTCLEAFILFTNAMAINKYGENVVNIHTF